MIDLSPTLPTQTAAAQPAAAPASASDSARANRFGQTLGAFLDARDAASAPPAASAPDRQDPAEDGKALPAAANDADQDSPQNPLAAPIWFPPLPTPLPTPVAATGSDATAVAATDATAPALPSAANLVASAALATPTPGGLVTQPVPPPAHPTNAAPQAVPPALAALLPGATDATVAQSTTPPSIDSVIAAAVARATPSSPKQPVVVPTTAPPADATPALAQAGAPAIAVSATPQPAGQVFAAAIATAWRDRSTRDSTDPVADTSALGVAAPMQLADHAVVHATGDSTGTALDLTQDTGLQRMIDHIETLRDDADSRDTRIRLVPDALGSVDVAVRQEGDRVHVHFTAEQDATRALIADAQPRLTELAAQRGVRIGDTSVGGDGAGGNAPTPQPRAALPAAPPRARAATGTESPTDTRIA